MRKKIVLKRRLKNFIAVNFEMDENKLKLWAQIKHFSFGEFDSPDEKTSGLNMNIELVKLLDLLREKCGFPLFINSGFRTQAHNNKVAVVEKSAHTLGLACDIACANSAERDAILKYSFELGILRRGVGENFVHLDMDFSKPQNVTWLYPPGSKG